MKSFSYGKAPFWLMIIALITGLFLFVIEKDKAPAADITIQIYYKPSVLIYRQVLDKIEEKYGIKISIHLVSASAQPQKVNTAFLADVAVPDIIEMENKALGVFTKGPLSDLGFENLMPLFIRDSLLDKFPQRRLKSLSVGSHLFAIPHDVHPTLWLYRKDILDSMGISMDSVDTWSKFLALGQKITRDTDGDGVKDKFMVDMPDYGDEWLRMILMQMNGHYFDSTNTLNLNSIENQNAIEMYTKMTSGSTRISFSAGWGQPFARALTEGKILFVFAPDWRAFMTKLDIPSLSGKLALARLPRFEGYGSITTTMGGTGLFMTKKGKDQILKTRLGDKTKREISWEIMKGLYTDWDLLVEYYKRGRTIPAFKPGWNMEEVNDLDSYYSNQPAGRMYAEIADSVPFYYNNAYAASALGASSAVMIRARQFYENYGEAGDGKQNLKEFIKSQLILEQEKLQKIISRNAFYAQGKE